MTKELRELPKLNLQFFAEPEEGDAESSEENETEEQSKEDKETTEESSEEKEKKFTQAELDRIIKERLQREEKKREEALTKEREEQERKRKEEQGEYKELSESLQKELDELKAESTESKKVTALIKAGYSEDKVDKLADLVKGDSDEAISASIDELKELVPVGKSYADPSTGNSGKQPPKGTSDGEDKGRELAKRLLTKRKPKK